MFSKWQRAEELCREKDRELTRKKEGELWRAYHEHCQELEHAVKELSELRQADVNEKNVLIKEKEVQNDELKAALDVLGDHRLKILQQDEQNGECTKNLQDTITKLRKDLNDLLESHDGKEREIEVLKEQNMEIHQLIKDRNDSKLAQLVTVENRHDLLLAIYMDTYPQDKKDLEMQFLDTVTHGSSKAFKLLVNKCYEDLVCNLRGFVLLVPNVESFVEAVFDQNLEVECIMYLRVVQCLNPSLFDTLESSLVKQHDLTKHKIHYRQVELTQARQVFALAFLSQSSDPSKKRDQCPPPAKTCKKIKFNKDSCKPVGFD